MSYSGYQVWAADPHQWGPGKVHLVDPNDGTKTFCGKLLSSFAGKPVSSGNPTCKICTDAPERRERAAERRAQYEAEWAAREQTRQQEREEWFARYNDYLATPQWRALRDRVLRRASGLCEGCGQRTATQVHHTTYEHVGEEFLWELRAVCNECHERLHQDRREDAA